MSLKLIQLKHDGYRSNEKIAYADADITVVVMVRHCFDVCTVIWLSKDVAAGSKVCSLLQRKIQPLNKQNNEDRTPEAWAQEPRGHQSLCLP